MKNVRKPKRNKEEKTQSKTTNRKEIALFRKRSVLIDWAGFFTGQIPVSLSLSVVWNIFCFFWGYPDTRAHTQKKKTL